MTLARDRVRLGDDIPHLRTRRPEQFAFDVHDGPSQAFLAVSLIVRDRLDRGDLAPDVRDLLARVLDLTREGKRQLDSLVEGMLLEPVAEPGLVLALHDLAARTAGIGGPFLDVDVSGNVDRLPADVERALFRAAEGAAVNAWRHGAAKRVLIELRFRQTSVSLRVSDDGCGLGPEGVREGRGLRGMRRRLQAVGGWLRVVGGVASGVVVEAEVPRESR